MSILDAYALIAYLGDEPEGPQVEKALRDPEPCISAVNLAEVVDKLTRRGDLSPEAIGQSLRILRVAGLAVIAADEETAQLAGKLRGRHYDRREAAVSLGDCFALATAMLGHATLVTSDRALVAAAHSEGVVVADLGAKRS